MKIKIKIKNLKTNQVKIAAVVRVEKTERS
jgi:hypothetical protein